MARIRWMACLLAFCLLIPISGRAEEETVDRKGGTAVDIPQSYVTNMEPQGYVANKVRGFLNAWSLDALDSNPELIEAVIRANHGKYAAGGPYEGAVLDTAVFLGQHLTGLAYCYRMFGTEDILKEGNRLADAMAQAAGPTGYLGPHADWRRLGGNKLGPNENWDIWGQYHAIYGLYEWYKTTGDSQALRTAMAAADYCIRHFENRTYAVGFKAVSNTLGHAYALLYKETGEERYLKETMRILEKEWPGNGDWLNNAQAGKDFYQSDEPRWEALHCIMMLSTLYEITGEQTYYDAVEQIWWSLVKTDRHDNGAFSTREMATGSPYDGGAIETCCSIAWIAYSVDYLRFSKNSYVADEMEMTYYNAILGCITENLREVTYDNPMEGHIIKSQIPLAFCYNAGAPDINCCQANSTRGMGEVSRWAALTDRSALYLNYYGPSVLHTKTPGGQDIRIGVEGEYPVSGDVRVTLEGMEQPEAFDLALRIPCWSQETCIGLNGDAQKTAEPGRYHIIRQEWKNGDEITLKLDMSLHFWAGEGLFAERTAVYRGPLLLAQDLAESNNRILPRIVFTPDALKNATVRTGDGLHHWIVVEAECTTGDTIRLIDYASAGKTGGYYTTWLRVKPPAVPHAFSREGAPVWVNREIREK